MDMTALFRSVKKNYVSRRILTAVHTRKVSFVDSVLISWESLPGFMNWSLALMKRKCFSAMTVLGKRL